MRLKRVISAALAVSMAVSMLPVSALAEEPAGGNDSTGSAVVALNEDTEKNGYCGAEGSETAVHWELVQNEDGSTYTLKISGDGAMADYVFDGSTVAGSENDARPWAAFLDLITEVQIGEGITGLGDNVFREITKLEKVVIPKNVTDLGDYIFRGDTSLSDVTWEKGFTAHEVKDTDSDGGDYVGTYVPTSMFDFCSSLGAGTKLSDWLPESFTGVGCAAFRGTQFIVDVDDLNNLGYIGAYAFASMPHVKKVDLDGNKIELGLRYSNHGTGLLVSNAFKSSGLEELSVKNMNSVPMYFADDCKSLSKVTLDENVTEIENGAFRGCSKLTNFEFGNNIAKIDEGAFQSAGIAELTIPNHEGTVEIGKYALAGCNDLKQVTFHDKVVLNTSAFAGCGIEKFVIPNDAEVACNGNPFQASSGYNLPAVTTLKTLDVEGVLKSNTDVEADTQKLWSNMFSGNTQITEVNVSGDKMAYVSGAAFPKMEKLTVTGGDVQGTASFYGNAVLKSVDIDVNSYQSQKQTFRCASELETFKLKATTAVLGEKDFVGCGNLKKIDLSECETITYGVHCFSPIESTDEMNSSVIIYVNEEKNNPRNSDAGLSETHGIVMVTRGGTVALDADGFASVTKLGHTATWYEDADLKIKTKDEAPQVGKTYYADWTAKTYKVSFVDENGGALGDAYPEQNLTYPNTTMTEPADPEAKEGYTFIGWYTADGKKFNFNESVTSDVILHPEWVADHVLTVKYGTISAKLDDTDLTDEEVALKKDGNTVTATIPEGSVVTVTFDDSILKDSGSNFDQWKITPKESLLVPGTDTTVNPKNSTITFVMPKEGVTIEAMTKDATIEDDSSEALGIAAAVVTGAVGTAVLTYQGYMLGTELYLTYLLPAGAAIPANRAELAMLVWQDAGKPEPAAPVALDAADDVKALTWAVETGLMDDTDKNGEDLAADASVSRIDVIKMWKKAQALKES